jgi:small nuclear ribonucleoprotein (snRNP)-like protein
MKRTGEPQRVHLDLQSSIGAMKRTGEPQHVHLDLQSSIGAMKRTGEAATETRQNQNPDIPVSLGKPSLRVRLESYYSLISPDIISNETEWRRKLDIIYQKFGGSHEGERKLATKLEKKYGSTVRLLLAASTTETTTTNLSEPGTNSSMRNEAWFSLRPEELASGNLSFVSNCFDPEAALRAPESEVNKVNPWIHDARRLDTVGKFCVHLPADDPLKREQVTRKHPPSTVASDDDPKKKTRQLSAFASIAENCDVGPLSVLFNLQRQRVRVLIRYVNAIRGTVTGTLVAFDKHMNMILRDAEEVYTPRPVDEEPKSNVENELDRRRRALQECNGKSMSSWCVRRRNMKQLLVRGDSVVLVYKAENERSAWPKTAKSPTESRYKRPTETVPDDQRVGSPGSLTYALQRRQKKEASKNN